MLKHITLIAALSMQPFIKPLILGTLGITSVTTAVVLQPSEAKAEDAAALARIAQVITVRIEGTKQASGVLIKKEANLYTVLTSWNAVRRTPLDDLVIVTPDNKKYRVLINSAKRVGWVDMAVLVFKSSENYQLASIGDIKRASIGDSIFVSGFPMSTLSIDNRILRFIRSSVVANKSIAIKNGYQLVYSNEIRPGMIGGAVLNELGELVGIHGHTEIDTDIVEGQNIALTRSTNYAIPIDYFEKLKPVSPGDDIREYTTLTTSADEYLVMANSLMYDNLNEPINDYSNISQVISLCNKSLALKPSADAYAIRGIISLSLYGDDYNIINAFSDLSKAIELDPNHVRAYYWRGRVGLMAQTLKNLDRSISDLNKAKQLDYKKQYTQKITFFLKTAKAILLKRRADCIKWKNPSNRPEAMKKPKYRNVYNYDCNPAYSFFNR